MSHSHSSAPTVFSQVDVSAGNLGGVRIDPAMLDQAALLREVLAAQDRTNEILEELVGIMGSVHKQRHQELHNWKNSNPRLADSCRQAADALGKVQVEYLERLTEEIADTAEDMVEGEFLLNEFVDRFGPRLAHLNGVIQFLSQLGTSANQAASTSS